MENELVIIYSLRLFQGAVSYYYPEAFLAEVEKGFPSYIKKIAIPEVIESYGIEYKNTDHEFLLNIVNYLSPNALSEDFQKKSKKKLTLHQLFESDTMKKSIQLRINQGLSKFLNKIEKNSFELFLNVERKTHLERHRLKFSPIPLLPFIKLKKTEDGTDYQLQLLFDKEVIVPKDVKLEILVDQPCMILAEMTIFSIPEINGLKVKPFINKEKIPIPNRFTYKYFNDFLKEILPKAQVEVEGFAYEIINATPRPVIKFSTGLTMHNYQAIPSFDYDIVKYNYGDNQATKVSVDFNEANEIKVTQLNRNFEAEEKAIKLFDTLGLPKSFNYTSTDGDPYESLTKVKSKHNFIKEQGWEINYPQINGRELNLSPYEIKESVTSINDWFDVYAKINIGVISIPFTLLIRNIKNKDRLYKLADGTMFIIPIEWMERYDILARFGTIEEEVVRIPKSNYTIIEQLGIELEHKAKVIVDENDFEFQLPNMLAESLAASNSNLRSYQYSGAKWLVKHYKNGMGACLADDMGLGKTLQTITLLCHVKENLMEYVEANEVKAVQLSLFESYTIQRKALQALIVVPASLIFNWERELKRFAPKLFLKIHQGAGRSNDYRDFTQFDIILTSYPIITKDHKIFEKINFEYIVIDEAHYIKNRDSKVFKALNNLSSKNKLSLSGTPIENSLADLWSQMQFINPSILLSYPTFKKMYQDPIEKSKDVSALAELKQLLQPFILRRTKQEVLSDLPDLEEQIYYCTMLDDQRSLIETEKSRARNSILGLQEQGNSQLKLHVLNALMRLRQIANHPKIAIADSDISSAKFSEVIETVETLSKSDNKLLLFSSFVSHLEIYELYFMEHGLQFEKLTGSSSSDQRKQAVDNFNDNPDIKIMLISIKAGGTGLNLTSANYVLLLDPWWNPFIEEQAKARAHRFGQERKVTVIKFITKDTIEEKILHLQISKLELVKGFLEEEMVSDLDDDLIKYFLE